MSKQFSFNSVPILRRRRSAFDLSFTNMTTMSVGKLYPVYVQEVYPGDTFKCSANIVTRVTSSFLKPIMDNLFMDTHFFFVPNRLVMNDWASVMGENKNGSWAEDSFTVVPGLSKSKVGSTQKPTIYPGSVGDYLGLPLGELYNNTAEQVNVLPFRAFALIWDEWYRDQNNMLPMHVLKSTGTSSSEFPDNSDWSPNHYTGKLPFVSKTHDYFTSALPSPQKGNAVDLFGGQVVGGDIPVHTSTDRIDNSLNTQSLLFSSLNNQIDPATYSGGALQLGSVTGQDVLTTTVSDKVTNFPGTGFPTPVPRNLWATSPEVELSLNVNELREAIALQRMLEKDAIGGTRYTEYILSHFGVSSPDSRLNRTELLGGVRNPLSVQQVAQTSESTTKSPLANIAAYSLSNGKARYTKGFTEHGFVIGVSCIKYFHTYQQGIERFWLRKQRTDYYDPVFANIGEQPIYREELVAHSVSSFKTTPFGYNEAWADLRYRPNRVTGQMRSDIEISLPSQDIWHFADVYDPDNPPVLNEQFIRETPDFVDRTLSVPSSSEDQFLVDIHFNQVAYRELPVYSTPSTMGVR